MKFSIKRSDFNLIDVLIACVGSLIPSILAFFFIYSGKSNAVALFFNIFFIMYVPAFTFSLVKRTQKFKKIDPKKTVSPILIRLVLGVLLTGLICRPLVTESTIFVEIFLYFLVGPALVLFKIDKK